MKYLIAVDGSANSKFAFRQAKKNIFTEKDHVYILTVTESPSAYPFEDILNFNNNIYEEMNKKIEMMSSDMLKQYGRKLTKRNIPHTCLIAKGAIKDVICKQAQELAVDIVIMGRRGLGTLERTFIGSTSQYCVHNLTCSVLVIPENAMNNSNVPSGVKQKSSAEQKADLPSERNIIEKNECDDPQCKKEECLYHGKVIRQKECDDPQCRKEECATHGKQVKRVKECDDPQCRKEECATHGKGRKRVKECDDPQCRKEECDVHGKGRKEKIEMKEMKGGKEKKDWKEGKEKAEGKEIGKERKEGMGKEKKMKECDDPQCRKEECATHGKQVKRVKECDDPQCRKEECDVHGKGRKEKIEMKEMKGGKEKKDWKEGKEKAEGKEMGKERKEGMGRKEGKESPGSMGEKTYASVVESSKDKPSPEVGHHDDFGKKEAHKMEEKKEQGKLTI